MQQLTAEGRRIVNELSQRHGFSPDAVTQMLIAVLNGNGSMAQFSHPEFGGSGQWMRGGMIMLGDMFNNNLKGRVDTLCSNIADILGSQPGLLQSGSFQSQSQGNFDSPYAGAALNPSTVQNQFSGVTPGPSALFVPDPHANWWPGDLGAPSASGNQNAMRYAYFANARRLAVDAGGEVWVYDTQDHQIGGFSQQQGSNNSITFSSQFGTVNLSSLPVVTRNGNPVAPTSVNSPSPATNSASDIYTAIERLGDLKSKGILSDEEFAAKKAELLARI
ncbi:MAG: SHOCT domain-containing protein [Planctomycetota bacterium]|nr:SHOCT domain-containing protein [Planctomycetota bacterium]